MHFVDRKVFPDAPLKALDLRHVKEQQKWLDYKAMLLIPKKARTILVSKPSSYWIDDARVPLILLFRSNCAYCGIYADADRDGEIDHHFPKELDEEALHIYDWCNYVWACHSCNGEKNNNYPILNPCCSIEMSFISFQESDGKYICDPKADNIIKETYQKTVLHTFINGKNRPNARKVFFKQLTTAMNSLKSALFEFDMALYLGESTNDIFLRLVDTTTELKNLISPRNYLLLAEYAIKKHKENSLDPNDFPYELDDFL